MNTMTPCERVCVLSVFIHVYVQLWGIYGANSDSRGGVCAVPLLCHRAITASRLNKCTMYNSGHAAFLHHAFYTNSIHYQVRK